MRWGANPEDWTRFCLDGLTTELLPVVSNPNAVISPRSVLKILGKVPSLYNSEREVVGIGKWPEVRATPAQIKVWSEEPDYGICIQCRTVRAFDVDISPTAPENLHQDIQNFLRETPLGLSPVRYRNDTPRRFLIPFCCAAPLYKQTLTLPNAAGIIEILADGQQFVAAGTHPQGARYLWLAPCAEFIMLTASTLKEITAALCRTFHVKQHPFTDIMAHAFTSLDQHDRTPDPVVAWLDERDWIIRTAVNEDKYYIHCPFENWHTNDSGPSECVYFAAGTEGYARGHFHCLHAHCVDRSDEEFLDAVGFRESLVGDFEVITEPAPNESDPSLSLQPVTQSLIPPEWIANEPNRGLRRSRKGFTASLDNLVRALATPYFWREIAFDNFRQELLQRGWGEAREWTPIKDADTVAIRILLEKSGFEPVGRELMRDALMVAGENAAFDSAVNWLKGLSWDRVKRVDSFFETYCGAAHGAYARSVSRYLWTALAGRVLIPGCQADMVPILVGAQGVGKTRGIEAMVPVEHYATIDLNTRDADLARRMRGRLVVEIAELRGLHTRDRTAINDFITQRSDVWTPKYREYAVIVPRRCVLIGTTNDQEFLADETGNRRWLPLRVAGVDVEGITRDRKQLWAEAAALFVTEGVCWEQAQQLAINEHDQYRLDDALETEVEDWLKKINIQDPKLINADLPFALRDVILGCGFDPRQTSRVLEWRLGKILRVLGFEKTVSRTGGGRAKRWKKV